MNKKAAKAMKKGYREAGQIYWTDEMAAILKTKNRQLKEYKAGFYLSLGFAAFVALVHLGVIR